VNYTVIARLGSGNQRRCALKQGGDSGRLIAADQRRAAAPSSGGHPKGPGQWQGDDGRVSPPKKEITAPGLLPGQCG